MIFQIEDDEIDIFRSHLKLPSLDIHINSNLGSDKDEHSKKIHSLLDIQKKRYPHSLVFSISHAKGLGGLCYVTSASQKQTSVCNGIGLDIEETHRVRAEIIHRVRFDDEEIQNMPSPGSLWTAKESTFKALRGETQPLVVTSIQIGNWKKISSQIETFELLNKSNFKVTKGLGVILQKSVYQIAIFYCDLNYST